MEKSKRYIKTLLVTLTLGTGIIANPKIANDVMTEQEDRLETTTRYEEEQLKKIMPIQEQSLSLQAKQAIDKISGKTNKSSYLEALEINTQTLLFG